MRGAALLAAVLAAVAAGCGGSGAAADANDQAGVFITKILHEEITGEWSLQWGDLHPGHQRLITRHEYVACSKRLGTNVGLGGATVSVRGVRDEPIHVRGVPQRTAKVVTVRLRQRGGGQGVTYHLHAVRVGGRWAWILGGAFLQALAHGRCPDGSPVAPPV